ncbi:MAG: hypothetical protein KY455_10775 [Euryarchaeota archaeon]|nr:hypothetical protein [Euryarchaeota archaeon]
MRKILALAIVALFSAAAVPAVDAGEVKTAEYDIPSGPVNIPHPTNDGRYGPAISTRPCAPEWRDWGNEAPEDQALTLAMTTTCEILDPLNGGPDDGFIRMGVFSAAVRSDCGDCYTEFLVSVTDTLPADTYYTFCIITNYQDGRDGTDSTCGETRGCSVDPNECDDIEDPRSAGCSIASLTSPVPAGGIDNRPATFVYGVYVDETTGQTCLGSKGSLTVDMS